MRDGRRSSIPCRSSRAILLLPVSPEALEEKELALLERNVKVIESPALKTDLEAREVSRLLDTY